MNPIKLHLFVFSISLVTAFSALLASNQAIAGWENGNAGDSYVSEFILTAKDLAQRFELLPADQLGEIDLRKLKAAIKSTEVVSEEQVMLNGFERDAVNYWPNESLIRMSRSRWRELRRPTETRARLRIVLHEYIWMTGLEDSKFQHSDRLIELLNIKNYSPNIWWNPVNPINTISLRLLQTNETCKLAHSRLDVLKTSETQVIEAQGDCAGYFRRVEIVKSSGMTPASSNIRGLFHSYQIYVFNSAQPLPIAEFSFEPEWGACLLPEGSCQGSGKLVIGGVEVIFWFLRN